MRRYSVFLFCGLAGLFIGTSWLSIFRPLPTLAGGDTITIHIIGATRPTGFLPALLSVLVNDTVVFLNDVTPAATYSVAADDQSFASPPIDSGQEWSTTFTATGVHNYTDPNHSAAMFGELVVVAASVQLLPTSQPGAVSTALAKDKQQLAHPAQSSASASSTHLLFVALVVGAVLLLAGVALIFWIRSKRRQKMTPSV